MFSPVELRNDLDHVGMRCNAARASRLAYRFDQLLGELDWLAVAWGVAEPTED